MHSGLRILNCGPVTTGSPRPEQTKPIKPRSASNYFRRHWAGQLSLPVCYWVNGSIATLLLAGAYSIVGACAENAAVRTAAWLNIGLTLILIVATIWSTVGIWRSAVNHPNRGGSRHLAQVAQAMLIVSALGFMTTLTNNLLPQLRERVSIAFGFDRLGTIDVKLTANGTGLVLSGMLGTDSAEKVRRLLAAAPGVRTLLLDSGGGRLKEAKDIARLARERRLNTYVESHCESACTYIFLAGHERAATPTAKVGFHPPSFPGLNAGQQAEMTAQMMQVYREAGLSQSFIASIERTPVEQMWYPSRADLIDNGVINRVSFGGVMASVATRPSRSKSSFALAPRNMPTERYAVP